MRMGMVAAAKMGRRKKSGAEGVGAVGRSEWGPNQDITTYVPPVPPGRTFRLVHR